MFSKKKKKPLISPPSNFEHRVHTGFDKREGKFVGLPLQWASLVGNNQVFFFKLFIKIIFRGVIITLHLHNFHLYFHT